MKKQWKSGRWIWILAVILAGCRQSEAPETNSAPAEAVSLPVENPPFVAGPEDLPPCPGYLRANHFSGDSRQGSVELFSQSSPRQLAQFYTEQLSAMGWILQTEVEEGSNIHFLFRRGGQTLRFQIGPAAGEETTRVFLAWTGTGAGGNSTESRAPELAEPEVPPPEDPSMEW